ncbi:SRPBCC family protein [Demequina lignilytica]|uniref:SRPBCC family protein n=1 Tax=Demequina lignilytica TaxID=3051663 RepID=A0AB35ML72_9MICO|nr:SRPBCC family protein [Demequina sp. SYSU T0a273]MDN4484498.1 SRPBCC family protein [Demequina sp. SYSU T0a273]
MDEKGPVVEESVHIEAQPHDVYTYCLDPRRIHDGDPVTVTDVTMRSGGVGTVAHLKGVAPPWVDERVEFEYTEAVPDELIRFEVRPTLRFKGIRKRPVATTPSTFTWTFTPEDRGTRLMFTAEMSKPSFFDHFGEKSAHRMIQARLGRIKQHVETGAQDS